ncbi:hypothetical protein F5884DRAFT_862811 [Xylogone sp. PMI_703]|nr:hypothetical protein F5884DRAFT_862811 [Xylogone sp. PMI_703]
MSLQDQISSSSSSRNILAVREPVNTEAPGQNKSKKVPPGIVNNKNGPPGPEGNQKGPPGTAADTPEVPAPITSQTSFPSVEVISSENPPTTLPALTPTTPVLTTTTSTTSFTAGLSSTPSSSFISSVSTLSTYIPISSVSTELPTYSAISIQISTPIEIGTSQVTTIFSNSALAASGTTTAVATSESPTGPPNVPLPSSTTIAPKVAPTTLSGMNNAITPTLTGTSSPQYDTVWSEHRTISGGQKAGIAVGAIAGFVFILTMILFLFKNRRNNPRELLPRFLPLHPGRFHKFNQYPRSQTPGQMSESLLTTDIEPTIGPNWDYQSAFAKPTVIGRTKQSLRRSLTTLHWHHLDKNTVRSQTSDENISNSRPFTFFNRLLEVSIPRSTFRPSFSQERRGIMADPQPPKHLEASDTVPKPRTAVVHSLPGERSRHNTDKYSPHLTIPIQVPSQTFIFPWNHRNSQMTATSEESRARFARSVPSWAKLYYSEGRHRENSPDESEKVLPQLSPVSPALWLKKILPRRPYSVATSISN